MQRESLCLKHAATWARRCHCRRCEVVNRCRDVHHGVDLEALVHRVVENFHLSVDHLALRALRVFDDERTSHAVHAHVALLKLRIRNLQGGVNAIGDGAAVRGKRRWGEKHGQQEADDHGRRRTHGAGAMPVVLAHPPEQLLENGDRPLFERVKRSQSSRGRPKLVAVALHDSLASDLANSRTSRRTLW